MKDPVKAFLKKQELNSPDKGRIPVDLNEIKLPHQSEDIKGGRDNLISFAKGYTGTQMMLYATLGIGIIPKLL